MQSALLTGPALLCFDRPSTDEHLYRPSAPFNSIYSSSAKKSMKIARSWILWGVFSIRNNKNIKVCGEDVATIFLSLNTLVIKLFRPLVLMDAFVKPLRIALISQPTSFDVLMALMIPLYLSP